MNNEQFEWAAVNPGNTVVSDFGLRGELRKKHHEFLYYAVSQVLSWRRIPARHVRHRHTGANYKVLNIRYDGVK